MAGRDFFVVGAGNSAGQAAIHLAKYVASVTLVVRGPGLAATMSEYLTGRALFRAADHRPDGRSSALRTFSKTSMPGVSRRGRAAQVHQTGRVGGGRGSYRHSAYP